MKINDARTNYWLDPAQKRAGSQGPDTGFGVQKDATASDAGGIRESTAHRKFAAALSGMGSDTQSRQEKAEASGQATEDKFLNWAKMSAAEKIRSLILEQHRLTEEALQALPKAEREKIEDEIKEAVKRHYGVDGDTGGESEASSAV